MLVFAGLNENEAIVGSACAGPLNVSRISSAANVLRVGWFAFRGECIEAKCFQNRALIVSTIVYRAEVHWQAERVV